jgi:hypothetical protein
MKVTLEIVEREKTLILTARVKYRKYMIMYGLLTFPALNR